MQDDESRRATAGTRGDPDRVRHSHAQTRTTLRLALAFTAAAVVAAPLGGSRWLLLHLFLAGGVVLAISAVTLMLTVTWSAAPAPGDTWVAWQRWCIAAGAAGLALGRGADLSADRSRWILAAAGCAHLVGLALLAGLLVVTVGRGVERRFDPAVVAYVAALAAGGVGVALGVVMVSDTISLARRNAHVTANLLGLVGLVVAGTMPYFAATVGRSKMSPLARPHRLRAVTGSLVVALVVAMAGLAGAAGRVAALGLAGYTAGIGAALWLSPRPTRRQWQWAGPRLLALWCGGCWWAIGVAATAVDVLSGEPLVFAGRWAVVVVLGGYAQILWGSLAYLLPMLRGGGPARLSEGFATTRSWLGLVAANAAALGVAVAVPSPVVAVAAGVWVLDAAWRAARVGTARAGRPDAA